MEGWEKHYPGMIEWQDPKMHGGIKRVDPKTNEVKTDLATHKAALVNVIPAQMAGRIARDAGLADESGFCPIDPEIDEVQDGRQRLRARRRLHSGRHAEVGVLGQQPGQGRRHDHPRRAHRQPHLSGALSNTCWSLIAPDDDVKVGGTYEPGDGKIKQASTFVSQKGEAADLRKQNYQESLDWYAGIVADVFG